MKWPEIPFVWQECFNEAWKSFQEGSRPIGALVTDEQNKIIARGKSAAFNTLTDSVVSNNELAHAEINALMKLDNRIHPIRNTYTLYSTMEPCPLCFGAFYMSGIRKLEFAAKDKWAGSTNLKDTTPYLSFKPIEILGPLQELEQLSIVLNAYFELSLRNGEASRVTECWKEDYPEASELAVKWFADRKLKHPEQLQLPVIFEMMQNEIKMVTRL